jgi:hypothetical protein
MFRAPKPMFRSSAEDEPCAGIGAQEFVRHIGFGHLVERLTGAVQWNEDLPIILKGLISNPGRGVSGDRDVRGLQTGWSRGP